jgi:DNA-binding response OmpR family regulator
MARILVVDDDLKTARTVALYLEHEGHTVLQVHDGMRAVEVARSEKPDLIVLDVMLPQLDGLDVARLVRTDSAVPIIMVTARTQEEDSLVGFSAGADDYVRKPFSPRELVARVRVMLRRAPTDAGAQKQDRIGSLQVDHDSHLIRWAETPIHFTPTEFRLIEVLATHPGRVFPRSELIDRVMGISYPGVERSIDTHIANARKKFRAVAGSDVILTVHGVGYKLGTESHA